MNMIIIIIIYIYTLYQLSEYFYYNKKYHTLENIIYTITSVAFFINVIISYTQNKNNVQTQWNSKESEFYFYKGYIDNIMDYENRERFEVTYIPQGMADLLNRIGFS